jgi:hypothetical protein
MHRFLVVLLLLPVSSFAQVSLRAQEDVDYIYKVISAGCPGGQLSQTGFRVQGVAGIVTALHGIAGCRTITAHGRFHSYSDLKVGGIDLRKDVALLTRTDMDGSQGLLPVQSQQRMQEVAQPGARLTVVGYPDGIKGQATTHLNARPIRPLRDLVPAEAVELLTTRGSPSPDTAVLFIEGHLIPGHSGAPVMDAQGRVVAVGDGGISKGTVEHGWAIPWPSIEWTNPGALASELDRISRLPAVVLQSKVREEQIDFRVGVCPSSTDLCDRDPRVLARPPLADPRGLQYRMEATADALKILPSMDYLDAFQAGGLIHDMLLEGVAFEEPPPILDLRVTNNSDRTIYFSAARFEVEHSVLDPSPLLLFGWDPMLIRAGIAELSNEGWGTARDVELQFNLRPPEDQDDGFVRVCDYPEGLASSDRGNARDVACHRNRAAAVADVRAADSPATKGPFRHRIVVGDVRKLAHVDFAAALLREGIRVRRMLRYGDEPRRSSTQPPAIIPPAYRSLWAIAEGQLRFVAASPDGELAPRSVAFSIGVPLMDRSASGAAEPPSGLYAVELEAEGTAYTREIPISQYLKAGEVDRFTIRVWVPKSSIHAFRLRLVYEDGRSVLSPPIGMSYFRSVSMASAIENDRRRRAAH